jgi:hypothetical protein
MFAYFSGDKYYPIGGWDDFKESFARLDEAQWRYWDDKERTERGEIQVDWAQIVDLDTMQVIWSY